MNFGLRNCFTICLFIWIWKGMRTFCTYKKHDYCIDIIWIIGKILSDRYFICLRTLNNFFQKRPLTPRRPLTPHSTVHDNLWLATARGNKENIQKLNVSWMKRDRRMMSLKIPYAANGKCLSRVQKRQIFNCPAGIVQRLFNCIPGKIRNITGVTSDTFKNHLDEWLKKMPDQPRVEGYSEQVAAKSNGIKHQAAVLRTRRWPSGVTPLS